MINKSTYLETTLEVLATFHMYVWDEPNAIHFQILSYEYHLSYTELTLYLGLYDHEYITTNEYRHLHSFPCLGEHNGHCWSRLSSGSCYFTPSVSMDSAL